jgi:hypothetical protein
MVFYFPQSYCFKKYLPATGLSFTGFCTFDDMFVQKKILFILFIFISICSNAQFFDNGQDPASVKWKIIKTKHFKVIYPIEIEKQAQHIANMLEEAFVPLSASLKSKPVNISVILHNRSTTSNAMVPWAPKRMEWYTCPGQDDYPQPWFDQLVVHEFRHVVQYSKMNSGFTKVLTYIMGQQIIAGVLGAFVPLWFIEGDAVCTETAFSNSGRGRMPDFEMGLRSQVLDKGIYRYNKAVFGSYKTYTPGHYELGYHIVASAQKYFSYDVWESAMNRTAHLPFMVVPFSSGIHKVTRLYKVDLYKLCMQTLQKQWYLQDSTIVATRLELIPKKTNKFYSDYNYGSFIDKNNYLTVKSSIDDIVRFISIDSSGNETRLFTPGQYLSSSLSFAANKIVWAETANDIRWQNRSYAIIKSYNIQTHQVRQLTHLTRYFAPQLNHQGNKIVCAELATNGMSFLTILDAESGSVLNRVAADTGDFIMTPAWSDDDKEIVFIALNKSGKRIRSWNAGGECKDLTQPSFVNIQQPIKSGSYVYYVGSYSGINNIYRLDVSGQIVQLTSSRYGVTDPNVSADGKEIIYSDYTADGYLLVKASLASLPKVPLNEVANTSVKLYESVARDNKPLDFYQNPQTTYTTKPYHKILHLFNFHSWGPLSIDAGNNSIKPGFEIVSQNLLSTMIASAGYEHDWLKPNQQFYAKLSYNGLYPQFDFQLNYHLNKPEELNYNTFSAQINMKVPFDLSSGKYYRSIQPQIGYTFYKIIPHKNYTLDGSPGYYHTLNYRFYGYNVIKSSPKDINAPWEQVLDIRYENNLPGGVDVGNIFSAESMFYFPGIVRHHSFNMYLAYQKINSGELTLPDIIASPQGDPLTGFHQLITGKFNYELPLFYPDWSIGSLLYIKRFRAALHYDEAYVTDWYKNKTWRYSAGVSLLSDLHVLRFLAPLTLGCRATYTFYNRNMIYEVIYNINFNQLYFKPRFSRAND